MSKIIVDLTSGNVSIFELTEAEIAEIEEIKTLSELDNALKPTKEEIENAEFNLILISSLTELGVI